MPTVWLISALEQIIAQGFKAFSCVSEERLGQDGKKSPSLLCFPDVPPAQGISQRALLESSISVTIQSMASSTFPKKEVLQTLAKSFLTFCDPEPPMSVCTQPGWRATQRTPCSRYPRDWHLVSMFRAACGTQGRDSGGRGSGCGGTHPDHVAGTGQGNVV